MDPFKILAVLLLLAIVASLGKALFHLASGPEDSGKTVRALTIRIGLSIALFLVLMIAWYVGGMRPHPGP